MFERIKESLSDVVPKKENIINQINLIMEEWKEITKEWPFKKKEFELLNDESHESFVISYFIVPGKDDIFTKDAHRDGREYFNGFQDLSELPINTLSDILESLKKIETKVVEYIEKEKMNLIKNMKGE